MLEVRDLACQRGDRRLFDGVGFSLEAGGLFRVAGPNGAGKTSLLRLLCGLMIPEAGEILWRDRNIRRQREEYHGELLYLGHANAVKDELTAIENVRVACAVAGMSVAESPALDALEHFGLARFVDLPAKHLSQGQRRRVALARLLLSRQVPLWVLDEPFTALDRNAVADLCSIIESHLEHGGMVVMTTHQEVAVGAAQSQVLDLGKAAAC
jgi:heme exporter protein A